jgi:hypothetical protein
MHFRRPRRTFEIALGSNACGDASFSNAEVQPS